MQDFSQGRLQRAADGFSVSDGRFRSCSSLREGAQAPLWLSDTTGRGSALSPGAGLNTQRSVACNVLEERDRRWVVGVEDDETLALRGQTEVGVWEGHAPALQGGRARLAGPKDRMRGSLSIDRKGMDAAIAVVADPSAVRSGHAIVWFRPACLPHLAGGVLSPRRGPSQPDHLRALIVEQAARGPDSGADSKVFNAPQKCACEAGGSRSYVIPKVRRLACSRASTSSAVL